MNPEDLLRFLRADPPKTARRRTTNVLPVDVTGRAEPLVFYRDAYGRVVPARPQDRPNVPKPPARATAGASADPDLLRRLAAALNLR